MTPPVLSPHDSTPPPRALTQPQESPHVHGCPASHGEPTTWPSHTPIPAHSSPGAHSPCSALPCQHSLHAPNRRSSTIVPSPTCRPSLRFGQGVPLRSTRGNLRLRQPQGLRALRANRQLSLRGGALWRVALSSRATLVAFIRTCYQHSLAPCPPQQWLPCPPSLPPSLFPLFSCHHVIPVIMCASHECHVAA